MSLNPKQNELSQRNLDGYFEFLAVDFTQLKAVYDWCNKIVHSAYQPYAWQIDYAHTICSGLFASGGSNPSGGWSVHGGVRTHKFEEMQKVFFSYCDDFCASKKLTQDWSIEFSGDPEAVLWS